MKDLKLVVLGHGGVGKSAFTVQYVQGVFVEKYDPTIEDSYRKTIETDGIQYTLEILDTAGTEQFQAMRDLYMKSGNGFLLVFDITNKITCDTVKTIYEQIKQIRATENVPCVFVGNKCDLEDQREINKEEIEEYCQSLGVYTQYIEASAKSHINVDQTFTELVRKIESYQANANKKKKGKCSLL